MACSCICQKFDLHLGFVCVGCVSVCVFLMSVYKGESSVLLDFDIFKWSLTAFTAADMLQASPALMVFVILWLYIREMFLL